MSRRKRQVEPPPPSYWPSVITIGQLEQLAGVEDRAAFWAPFARYADGFQRGVHALREHVERRITNGETAS